MTAYRPIEINTKQLKRKFLDLPEIIYKDYPSWVPPLDVEMKDRIDPRKNPFFEYGKVTLWGVLNNKNHLIARGAAILNPRHNKKHNDKTGFFGLFECINDTEAASCLFDRIKKELKEWTCDKMVGPVNFTTNDESGFLIKGFDSMPAFMTNYSPPYYRDLMESLGFKKEVDLYSYKWDFRHQYPPLFKKIIARLEKNSSMKIRRINRKELTKELAIIREVYNTSFSHVWGFVPITEKEAEEMGKAFTLFADDDLILFAEYNNKPIGFCLTLPDMNEVIKSIGGRLFPFGIIRLLRKRKKVKKARNLVLCVHPDYRMSGAAPYLVYKTHKNGIKNGYTTCEVAVVLELNHKVRSLLEKLQFKIIKEYRLYQSPLYDPGEIHK